MLQSLYRAGLLAALFGLLFVPGTTWAQDHRVRHVQDDADLFSKAAKSEANGVIDAIAKRHSKDFFVETVEKVSDEDHTAWAKKRFNNYKLDGVYLVFSKSPKFFRFRVGDETQAKYFTGKNIKELETILKNANSYDEKLTKAADYVLDAMNENHPKKEKARGDPPAQKRDQAQQPVAHRDAPASEMPSWVSWVCLIVVVLIVVWVIFAIIRSMTSMGGGYGGGYGGGGMGMGGGFLTGMLGGMFGAMAGMWLYNNMFGGHATYGSNGQVDWGGGQGSGASGYQGDTDNNAGGGGEDDGGGAADGGGGGGDDDGGGKGGGDDAGGGGDWGGGGDAGGGDAGGGGDWGGGGGDAGGGGDWGGGGGGDFGGGGGGDFGGGGGGDW